MVRDELGDCQRCKLAPSRTNLVFGVGNPDADLVFVGEAPGADEDAQGEPFVGKAGQLLTKMIEAMGYARDDVYICNVLKCRPPGNRNPEPDEVAELRAVPQAAARRDPPAHDRRAGEVRGAVPAARRHADHAAARRLPQLRGDPADADASTPPTCCAIPSKKKLAWEDLKAVNAALARVGIHPPRPPAGVARTLTPTLSHIAARGVRDGNDSGPFSPLAGRRLG